MFIGFIFIVALVNLLMASASAKWVLLAPIFVPMFMYLGYSPVVTQMAYRVGDSITPLLAYFAMLLAFARKYDKNIKTGTLISVLLLYLIFFAIMWIILFAVWILLGFPMGPSETLFINN